MKLTMRQERQCPNRAAHTTGPDGYLAWHAWADMMAQTHEQGQCPECKLWVIWTEKAQVVGRRNRQTRVDVPAGRNRTAVQKLTAVAQQKSRHTLAAFLLPGAGSMLRLNELPKCAVKFLSSGGWEISMN